MAAIGGNPDNARIGVTNETSLAVTGGRVKARDGKDGRKDASAVKACKVKVCKVAVNGRVVADRKGTEDGKEAVVRKEIAGSKDTSRKVVVNGVNATADNPEDSRVTADRSARCTALAV
jgi:hypothetical protein